MARLRRAARLGLQVSRRELETVRTVKSRLQVLLSRVNRIRRVRSFSCPCTSVMSAEWHAPAQLHFLFCVKASLPVQMEAPGFLQR